MLYGVETEGKHKKNTQSRVIVFSLYSTVLYIPYNHTFHPSIHSIYTFHSSIHPSIHSRACKLPSPTSRGYQVFPSGYQTVTTPCPTGYQKLYPRLSEINSIGVTHQHWDRQSGMFRIFIKILWLRGRPTSVLQSFFFRVR